MSKELLAQDLFEQQDPPRGGMSRWLVLGILLGLYLTLRGYHSRDGDQAYRLPLLLHQQSPSLYEDDPFVRAFDQFNPHRGAFLVLDAASRPLGLSVGLMGLFVLTFALTFRGVDRLSRAVWADAGGGATVGILAFILLLTAKAGNVGTNHLFESMLLDRLQAFALGWFAIAGAVCSGPRGRNWLGPLALGLATLIHPSAGLQLAMISAGSWLVWAIAGNWTGIGWRTAIGNAVILGISVVPGLLLNAGAPGVLLAGLRPEEYWTLAVELQSPQHMLPHLWRMPQWLAWGCYLALAAVALIEMRRTNPISAGLADSNDAIQETSVVRFRLILMLAVILAGLAIAWFGIEILHDVRITVFQPFRMATIARGIALVFLSGHVLALWRRSEIVPRVRAGLLVVGLIGDWLLVVVTAVELTAWSAELAWSLWPRARKPISLVAVPAVAIVLVIGVRFLSRHDTESGQIPLLIALGAGGIVAIPRFRRRLDSLSDCWDVSARRRTMLAGAAWTVPLLALLAGLIPTTNHPLAGRPEVKALIGRCRFFETPDEDMERLAVWCRDHTPESARFIGPPGPKTFRLWSRRSLAFNRASSPYHAAGLADWFTRFQDHVDWSGSAQDFVRKYVRDRHGIESRYQKLSDAERTRLAIRQGATHVIAASPTNDEPTGSKEPLELLHVEGRYAVYRVRPEAIQSAQLARSTPGDHRQR